MFCKRVFFIIKYLIILLVISIAFCSCENSMTKIRKAGGTVIDLSDSFYWADCDAASSIYSVANLEFHKLDTHLSRNLMKLKGTYGSYIWLKADFKIPEELRYKSLGFVISYLRFADKVWLNNVYIGGYGEFPPNEKNTLYASHFYSFPDNILKVRDTNTILIKVWLHGRSEISDDIFISDYDTSKNRSEFTNFIQSKIYLVFTGAMFCAFFLYFSMFIWRRKDKEYIAFAVLNVFTIIFLSTFYAPELPWYNSIRMPYLTFIKFTLCISFYFVITFTTYFIIKFLHVQVKKSTKILIHSLLWIPTIITIFIPNYNLLMRVCIPFLILMVIQLGIGILTFFKAVLKKSTRRQGFELLIGFSPVLISMALDAIVRGLLKETAAIYFSIFGWQITIITFIFMLSVRFNKVYRRNEYLNDYLESEVNAKTKSLSEANEKLEFEKMQNDIDLEMASIVQQKFFPLPLKEYKGWEIAVCYEPVAKVSGDLHDYYHNGSFLEGFSLFDVSGHGISASLITMLAKNIVFRVFRKYSKLAHSISSALYKINEQIINEKGDIEHYLTGLILRFSDFDENDICSVEMANAGHPHPFLYLKKEQKTIEIKPENAEEQFGAIGIRDVAVSFPEIDFTMACDDVFVCYTDGLTESMNKNREEFGKERVFEILNKYSTLSANLILEQLLNNLKLFLDGNKRYDDLTVIVLKRKSSKDFKEEELENLEEI